MSAPITIAAATAADIEDVMPIMDTAFDPAYGEAWTRGQCLGILSLPNVWLTIARDAEGVAHGFSLARCTVEEAELLLLAVEPAARDRGIGRALVERCAEDAATRGALHLLLEMRDNNPAGSLYTAAGFQIVGLRKAYYRGHGGKLHDALTMRRSLISDAAGASFGAPDALHRPAS